MANDTSNVAPTAYRPVVKTSKPMFYQTNKSPRHTQRNLAPVSHPPTTVKASNSCSDVTSSTGAPSKEGELCCYECGQKGHIKPQSPKLKGKQQVARVQIEDLIEEDEKLLETLMNWAPNDTLEESTYPQEGEDDLKNSSGDDEEDKPHYEWDDQEYKVNFVRFINEEPIIDMMVMNRIVEVSCGWIWIVANIGVLVWEWDLWVIRSVNDMND